MPGPSYLLLSLPTSVGTLIQTSSWIEKNINGGAIEVHTEKFPSFKVGTLDSLVVQSEELAKFDHQLHNAIGKVNEIKIQLLQDSNPNISNSSEIKLPKAKIDGKIVDDIFEKFEWKASSYRLDKPISELINLITSEALQLDADLRSQFQGYNTAKSNLLSCQRKQTGDLSVKSLHDVVSKENFVLNSDHLKTVLIAVPTALKSNFEGKYETLTKFVVPRSANLIASDAEYLLYGVTLFKKFELEFLAKAREEKWIPRDFEYSDAAIEQMKNEFDIAQKEEYSLKNDLSRLANVAYADITKCWIHIKYLRAFVESVLRYGLPPEFYCFALKFPDGKNIEKGKQECVEKYGYLGGNAFSKDNNGKVLKDSSLHEYANLVDTDYEPFVLYEIELL